MTTAETFVHPHMATNNNSTSASTLHAHSKPHHHQIIPEPTKLNVTDVVMHFGREYYTMLSRDPEHLHCFYGKQSSSLHAEEEDFEAPVCVGLEEIHERISLMEFAGARVVVSTIDCQPSMNGGILVSVVGSMHMRTGLVKKFVQTFFLAEQPNGYFVLNDILRFLGPTSSAPTAPTITSATGSAVSNNTPAATAITNTATNASPTNTTNSANTTPAPSQSSQPQVPVAPVNTGVVGEKPIGTNLATGTIQSEVSKSPTKSVNNNDTKPVGTTPTTMTSEGTKVTRSEGAKTKKPSSTTVDDSSAKKQPPAKPQAQQKQIEDKDEGIPSGPSSWATLAAVQQNKWGSGVVATAKGPVVSVPAEEANTSPTLKQSQGGNRVNYRTANNNSNNIESRKNNNFQSKTANNSYHGQNNNRRASGNFEKSTRSPVGKENEIPQSKNHGTNNFAHEEDSSKKLTESFTRLSHRAYQPRTNYDPNKSLYVYNIRGEIDREKLKGVFASVGAILSYEVVPTKGIAFIEYERLESAQEALSAGLKYLDQAMSVELRRPPPTMGSGGYYGKHGGKSSGGNSQPPQQQPIRGRNGGANQGRRKFTTGSHLPVDTGNGSVPANSSA